MTLVPTFISKRPWTVLAVTLFACIIAVFNVLSVEGARRADQFCSLSERAHADDVRALNQTYDYILRLEPAQLNDPLNQTILTLLPETEERAHTDFAPPLCDEQQPWYVRVWTGKSDIGLPEPDPKVPARPQKVDELLDPPKSSSEPGAWVDRPR